jgi:phage head maturation protease
VNKIKIIGPNEIRAAVTDNSVNEESRTVEVVWTTGARGLRRSWDGDFYEELGTEPENIDMSRLQAGAPFLAAHDASSLDSVIGVVESASIRDGKGLATIRFARDEKSQAIFEKVKDGILRNISVGYRIDEVKDVSKKGDKIPTLRATRWTPMEISAVAINFDKDAQVREETIINEVEVSARSEQIQETEMSEKNTSESVDTKALETQARQAEKTRQSEIRSAVRAAKLDEKFADELINQDLSADEARKSVLAKLESSAPAPVDNVRIEVGQSHEEKVREGVENALLNRINSSVFKLEEKGRQFRGLDLIQIAQKLGKVTGDSKIQLARSAMTKSDLPSILSNVAEKGLLARYNTAPETFSKWTRQDTLRNFKTKDLLNMGNFPSLSLRNEEGEFTYGYVSESKETVQMKKYGKILAFSEEMLVDDDLNALSQFVSEAGSAAKRTESSLVYAILNSNPDMADSVALFHADHDNLGTNGAPSVTTFNEAFAAMKSQMNLEGTDYLDIRPKYMICGPSIEATAKAFLAPVNAQQTSNVNIFAGSVELIVDPRITSKYWTLAADPSEYNTITLYRLEGQESPIVSTRNKWESGAFEIKVEHAAVAKATDYRGLFQNPYV